MIDIGELEDSKEADLALNWITGIPETQDDEKLYTLPLSLGSRVRDSVRSIYERPWFKRMWISSGSIHGRRCGGYLRHQNREVDAF